MRARTDPTPEQHLRRLRRRPESENDPRYANDAYWALRLQGLPHAYAKRALRDERPKVVEVETVDVSDCDPDELLWQPGTKLKTIEVAVRPPLTDEAIFSLQPRRDEYSVWDHRIPGFGVRVRPTGYKCFALSYRIRGTTRTRRFTIGSVEIFTLSRARDIARELLSEARVGRNPANRFRATSEAM
jgi:hypothetical protein